MSLDFPLNLPEFKIAMDNGSKGIIYAFDDFRLDAENLMLYRGDGEISLQPKVVKTLAVLIENRGSIISKDELIEQVWSDSVVEESNLFQYLYRLRRTLGKCPDGRPYIETLKRRGFRFNGDVVCLAPPEKNEPPAVAARASSSPSGVERSGNVLRIVDWANMPERGWSVAAVEPASVEGTTTTTPRPSKPGIAAVVFLCVTAIVAALLIYRSVSNVRPIAATGELSVLRLTNGIRPVDAAISPNGDYFVYHELSDDGSRLWLQQVGQAGRVELAPPSGRVYSAKTFSPDGKFIYFVASEDAKSKPALYSIATIGGPQAKLVSDVVRGPVSFSPDGREIVFARDSNEKRSLVVANTDGSNQRTLLEREAANLFPSPAWSPDGTVIVFAAADAVGRPGPVRLFGVNPTNGAVKQITDERWDNIYRIAWTYDGRGLVMIGTRAGEGYSTKRNQVYYLAYPGGVSRRLTSDGSWHQELSLGLTKDDAILAIPFNRSSQIWSMDAGGEAASAFQVSRGLRDGPAGVAPLPDGRVGFVSRRGEEINIWLMNADGSDLKQLSTSVFPVTEELRADPKGRFFVFSAFKDGRSHLYRFDTGGQDLKQLTFGDGNEVDSSVSPDGNWLIYQSEVFEGKSVALKLFRLSTDGGEPVSFGDAECVTPNYSPIGDLVSCIQGASTLILSALDGSEKMRLAHSPYARVNFGARWTPDGRGLVYIVNDKGFSNLWVQPLDAGKPRQLTNLPSGDIYNFAFSTDGKRLFLARGQQIADAILIRNYR